MKAQAYHSKRNPNEFNQNFLPFTHPGEDGSKGAQCEG